MSSTDFSRDHRDISDPEIGTQSAEEQNDSSVTAENNFGSINESSRTFHENMLASLNGIEQNILQGFNNFLGWMQSPQRIEIDERPAVTSDIENSNNHEATLPNTSLGQPPIFSSIKISNSFKNLIPYALIILSKRIFEFKLELICLCMLNAVFIKVNSDLIKLNTTHQMTVRKSLFVILFYIFITLGIATFLFDIPKNYDCTWSLILGIVINDFQVKLLFVGWKTLLACLPSSLFIFQMASCYQWIEITSQFYRSTLPISVWIFYLWDDKSYDLVNGGSTISLIVSVILAIFYSVSKIFELFWRGKLMINSFLQMLRTVKWGVESSRRNSLKSKGPCGICYTHTYTPVVTPCNHIFCQACLSHWLDKKKSCPLCRAETFNNFKYNNGLTTSFIQLF